MPKEKKYEHDFQQDLHQEKGIETIRNITETNAWEKPNWAVPASAPKNTTKSSIDTAQLKSIETKKEYKWEAPNWAVTKKKDSTTSTSNSNNNNNNEQHDNEYDNNDSAVIKDSIIQSNEQHPILKTSKQTQVDRELEELQKKYEETIRLKEKLVAEQKHKELIQKQKDDEEYNKQLLAKAAANSSTDGKYNNNDPNMTEEEKQREKEYIDKLKFNELRLTAKQKEDIAWKNKEAERREQERLRREEAKRSTAAELANKTRDDTSWQQQQK